MHHHYKKGVFGMAKKGWGKFVAFAAVTGAVAAGVSYVLQYKTYHRRLFPLPWTRLRLHCRP